MTERSWAVLQRLKGKFPFILIGGWAVWLWTRSHKSRDIDIIVDFKALEKLKKEFDLRKNDNLKKYEIKLEEIDIDIYVPYYSRLPVPAGKIKKAAIEGFDVAAPEELLILKQAAEISRSSSEKGEKDRIDVISLLLNCDIDFTRYKKLLAENKLGHFLPRLISVLRNFREYKYLGLTPRELSLRKRQLLERLRRL